MGYIIGTDEAGYGPNLGPLVISATAWHVPGNPRCVDLYKRLGRAVTSEPISDGASPHTLLIADSKAVYRGGQGFDLLERAALASLACCGERATSWHELWQALVRTPLPAFPPWQEDDGCLLPVAASAADLATAAAAWQSGLSAAGVTLCALRSRVIYPDEFNDRVAAEGSKGELLSQATVQLVGEVLDELPGEGVLVLCDKHGGRNRYGPLLQRQFPDPLIEVRLESRARSTYRWLRQGEPIEARFCACGETQLPVALASMVSKYVRELAMRAFNAFWQRHVPGIRPTAGYPGDARRFKAQIAPAQRKLSVDDHALWRCR